MAKEAIDEVESRKTEAAAANASSSRGISSTLYTDPNARLTGFTRGAQYEKLPNPSSSVPSPFQPPPGGESGNVPDDLLQFLNDAGPMQKTMNEGLSSDLFVANSRRKRRERERPDELTDVNPDVRGLSNSELVGAQSISLGDANARRSDSAANSSLPTKRLYPDTEITRLLLQLQQNTTASNKEDSSDDELTKRLAVHIGVPVLLQNTKPMKSKDRRNDQGEEALEGVWLHEFETEEEVQNMNRLGLVPIANYVAEDTLTDEQKQILPQNEQ
eukprot:CAMPEP_0194357014 /NCGR_PEP_ID=MMETSP0174-20130528/4559_1 /TAXON_ID=216777 /ORGANISM="Proboscia alata, Strain PI-D3" /LENGTH=272 /DNA_ID=CAMNT_0039126857 /DNA_START=89 /DNA_END=907 /DNA_ORIENTATION=-